VPQLRSSSRCADSRVPDAPRRARVLVSVKPASDRCDDVGERAARSMANFQPRRKGRSCDQCRTRAVMNCCAFPPGSVALSWHADAQGYAWRRTLRVSRRQGQRAVGSKIAAMAEIAREEVPRRVRRLPRHRRPQRGHALLAFCKDLRGTCAGRSSMAATCRRGSSLLQARACSARARVYMPGYEKFSRGAMCRPRSSRWRDESFRREQHPLRREQKATLHVVDSDHRMLDQIGHHITSRTSCTQSTNTSNPSVKMPHGNPGSHATSARLMLSGSLWRCSRRAVRPRRAQTRSRPRKVATRRDVFAT